MWCTANWSFPMPCQSLSPLVLIPMLSLKSLNVLLLCSAILLLIGYNMLSTWPLTRDLDIWPWIFVVYHLWRDETASNAQSSNPLRSYCHFNIWPNDFEHVLRVELGSPSLNSVQLSVPELAFFCCRQVISSWELDMWPLDLESLWYIVCHIIMVYSKYERN